jgi:bla regulator protein BlaR1
MGSGSASRARLILVATSALLATLLELPRASAQSATTDWEKAAGGKMSFDVASVKQDTSGQFTAPSFALDAGDTYPGNTTLFSAHFPLATFIEFAYKLSPIQQHEVQSQLPKWATTKRFDIEARAAMPSTKDQMRLMMQTLLAERFRLAIHFETQEKPVFELVLVKPGNTGPQLHRYTDDPPCDAAPPSGPNAPGLKTVIGQFPPMCYALMGFRQGVNGAQLITWGSRNVSMRQIASDMETAPTANIDRPVIDDTGLSGNFDFLMSFNTPASAAPDATQPEDSAPTFVEALKDQLGLKLASSTAPVETPLIDHLEEPASN